MKKLQPIYAVLITLFLLYAFSSNPPDGKTSAPGEGNCTECHAVGNASFDGTVSVKGLPDVVIPNTTYQVSVVTKVVTGSPVRAGFQMVILDKNNDNTGSFSNNGNNSTITTDNGKDYFEHNNSLAFNNADSVVWTVDWTAPSMMNTDSIKVYINSILGNGSGNSNDLMVSQQTTLSVQTAVSLPLEVEVLNTTNVSCFGENDGAITVEARGGTTPYTYLWSNDSTTASIDNLSAGDYSVTATDADSNQISTTITINQPSELIANAGMNQTIGCDSMGIILGAMDSSEGMNIVYAWTMNGATIATEKMPTVTIAGTYILTVMDTISNCSATDSVVVSQNMDAPTISIGEDRIIDCNDSDTVQIVGGAVVDNNFLYTWTTENGQIISDTSALQVTVVGAGTYTLTVIDTLSNCSASASLSIIEANGVIANAGIDGELNCTTPNLMLDGSNSTGKNLIYTWTTNVGNITLGQNTPMPTVDASGTYYLLVTDTVSGCTAIDSILVTQGATNNLFAASGDAVQLTCTQSSLMLNATADVGENIVYEWTTEAGNIVSGATTLMPVIDAPGKYILTVRDTITGCMGESSIKVAQDISLPMVSAGENQVLDCNNISVMLNGSTDKAFNATYVWTTENGMILSGANTLTPIVNAAGTYVLTVQDTFTSCSNSATVEVSTDSILPMANAGMAMQLDCTVDTLTLNGSGSIGTNYMHRWSTEDGRFINDSTLLTFSPSVTAGGTYTLTVIDTVSGCSNVSNVTISENRVFPTIDAGAPEQSFCANNTLTINATASGGDNLTYFWCTTEGSIVEGGESPDVIINRGGLFEFIVTNNNNGCKSIDSILVLEIENPSVMLDTLNDTTMLIIEGGTMPYTYTWSVDSLSSDIVLADLPAGDYVVTVTDANGCADSLAFMIEMSTNIAEVEATIENFQAYPNPVISQFNVLLDFHEVQNGVLIINNKIGQQMWTYTFKERSLNKKINTTNWPTGLYYLSIITEKGVKTSPFVVAR